MTGPSVIQRLPVKDREREAGLESLTSVVDGRAAVTRGIFSTWSEALRYVSVWVLAGLMVYALLMAGWLILSKA